jgi:hypothetical protein
VAKSYGSGALGALPRAFQTLPKQVCLPSLSSLTFSSPYLSIAPGFMKL